MALDPGLVALLLWTIPLQVLGNAGNNNNNEGKAGVCVSVCVFVCVSVPACVPVLVYESERGAAGESRVYTLALTHTFIRVDRRELFVSHAFSQD